MTDRKINSKFFSTILKSSQDSNGQTNIFEYDVSQSPKYISVFRDFLSFRPKFFILLINLITLLSLLAIGFGLFILINHSNLKKHGDYCNLSVECSSDDYLICSENKCQCPEGMFYKTTCVIQYSYSSVCSNKYENECGYGLSCLYDKSGTSRCFCSSDRYWNTQINYCDLQINFDQTGCTDSSQCKKDSNLECLNSLCTCVYPYFWNGIKCSMKSSYLEDCSIELGCDETKLLNCKIVGESLYRCECDYTRYWSAHINNCTERFLNDIGCEDSNQCRTDLGLQCIQTSGSRKCLCEKDFFWNGTHCEVKFDFSKTCTSSIQCNENQGLDCLSGICNCSSDQYHDGKECNFFVSYGLSCNSTSQCDVKLKLSCNETLNQCLCPEDHFWNYQTCELKLFNGSSCINDIQCDTTKLLSCEKENQLCLCDYDYFWNSSALLCMPKLEFNSSCNQTFECQDYLDLECLTVCECSPSDYWNGSRCSRKLSFGEFCDSSLGQEPCMDSKNLFCSLNECRCPGVDKYWNSTDCVPKLFHGDSCVYETVTMKNSQCADYDNYSLVCLATPFASYSWTCKCPSTKYYNESSKECINRKTFRESCETTSQCEDYFGLICFSNQTCLCPFTKYWNETSLSCDGANEPCQDYAFIYCLSNICQCNPERYFDANYSACLPRSSHNQYCENDDQCMISSPRPLLCISNRCQCRNVDADPGEGEQVFWSTSNNSCVPCPTDYKTGYGYGVFNSSNRITNRCYKTIKVATSDYDTAQDDCQQDSANLVGSMVEPPYNYTWIYNNDIPIRDIFYCGVKPEFNDTKKYFLLFDGYCLTYVENNSSYGYICELN